MADDIIDPVCTKWTYERDLRHLLAASLMPTGNPYLDDLLFGGLMANNLVLAAAKTGVGKTFWGLQLAYAAAQAGKKVKFFALEADELEIERRQLYIKLTTYVRTHMPQLSMPAYREWIAGGFDRDWEGIERIARREITVELDSFETVYCPGIYTPEMFRGAVEQVIYSDNKPNLLILDHLHHFFLEGNELTALKSAIHSIKKLQELGDMAIVVLAQLRKDDGGSGKQNERTLPILEDIRGTAALTDVATDVLLISPVPTSKLAALPHDFYNPMYFHLAKCRTVGYARDYAGIVGFDAKTGAYTKNYFLCDSMRWEDPQIISGPPPKWAKRAIWTKLEPVNCAPPVWAQRERYGKDD